MREPLLTTITLFGFTCSTGTSRNDSPSLSSATSGDNFMSEESALRARATLKLSSNSESAKRKATAAPSCHSPIAAAPATATVMSTFMSSAKRRMARMAFGKMNQPPLTIAAAKRGIVARSSWRRQRISSPTPVQIPEIKTEMSRGLCAVSLVSPASALATVALRPSAPIASINNSGVMLASCEIVALPASKFARTSRTPGSGLSARWMAATSSAQSIPAIVRVVSRSACALGFSTISDGPSA